MAQDELPQTYLITPSEFDHTVFSDDLARVLDAHPVVCVRMALATRDETRILKAGDALREVCHARDVAFLINDHAELAAELGADGVHVGADDTPYDEARRLVGDDAIVGVSCYASRHDAMIAAEAGADYVAFGAFFPTETKAPRARPEVDILA